MLPPPSWDLDHPEGTRNNRCLPTPSLGNSQVMRKGSCTFLSSYSSVLPSTFCKQGTFLYHSFSCVFHATYSRKRTVMYFTETLVFKMCCSLHSKFWYAFFVHWTYTGSIGVLRFSHSEGIRGRADPNFPQFLLQNSFDWVKESQEVGKKGRARKSMWTVHFNKSQWQERKQFLLLQATVHTDSISNTKQGMTRGQVLKSNLNKKCKVCGWSGNIN